ncbi:TIGR04104 family putative zinc finger protein [Schnuerera sp.]|uniref:TIGR04104 family putative zinc finger protein n=1 Tax=Schnuerera sp. TaxID=2794844 RepID=UPI002CF39907|nr:TIGR04104 family putative zinc finger protein [Schnuerera sp.]HSH35462.1 TIGR04104 family putative zinc finger protein [Schnuerera sp.]
MQRCKSCGNKFKWKDIIKSIWVKGYSHIVCSKCDSEHRVKFITRLIIALFIVGPTILINNFRYHGKYIFSVLNLSSKETILIYLIWIVLIIIITPIFARYKLIVKK